MRSSEEIRANIERLTARRDALVDTSSNDPAVARLSGRALRQQHARADAYMRCYSDLAKRIEREDFRLGLALAREERAADRARGPVVVPPDATHVRTRLGWWRVVKVNRASVTVDDEWLDPPRIPFSKVLEVRPEPPVDESLDNLRRCAVDSSHEVGGSDQAGEEVMETYKVDITNTKGDFCGSVRVNVTHRSHAPAAALARYIELCVDYNAKYRKSFTETDTTWMLRSENPADYTTTKVRKVAKAA